MTTSRTSGLANLFPGYFALVMATGIIAIGAFQQGWLELAKGLWIVAAAACVVLAMLYLLRLARYPDRFLADLTSHPRGFAFLTVVAGLNVVGSGAALIFGAWPLAWACWVTAVVLWPALLYPALVGVILSEPKPDLAQGINGTWFLLTVSTQSIAVLAGVLLVRTGPNQGLELVAVGSFTLVLFLYLIVMTLLFLRWAFRPTEPEELQPPSWIAAGAVAITVLAGSNLLAVAPTLPWIRRLSPFIEGLVILAWATATFWIPVMVAIGVWRHLVRRVPLTYHPALWAMVFPLGMYGACTYRMAAVTGFDALDVLPKLFLAIALIAWTATSIGLVTSTLRRARRSA